MPLTALFLGLYVQGKFNYGIQEYLQPVLLVVNFLYCR